eukprot:NODE_3_length_80033_cov_0.932970.p23 type:complete len:334 gc:universal NODE_3_length_80033_cov_0.932970:51377-50376(-)
MHNIILASTFLTFTGLFVHYRHHQIKVEFASPKFRQFPTCNELWCSDNNEFVLPSKMISLIKELNILTIDTKFTSKIKPLMQIYLQSEKFRYIAVDVKGHHGIILLNYYVKSFLAGMVSKRELLLNKLILPSKVPTKKLKGIYGTVNEAKQLFETSDMIISIDPNLPLKDLQIPLLEIPNNIAAEITNYVLFEMSALTEELKTSILLYQKVLQDSKFYSIAIKLQDKLNLKCIDKLVAGRDNVLLFISGPRKQVRKIQLKYYYLDVKVITTLNSKFMELYNTRIDWSMIHDYISLSAKHIVADGNLQKVFLPFMSEDQRFTDLESCSSISLSQ